MGDDSDGLNDILARWHKRFQHSISIYDEGFAEHGFDDLVVTVVTATYIEGLLYLGVQFSGYAIKPEQRLMLGRLVTIAEERGTVTGDSVRILRHFAKIRNGFAHNLDYRVEMATVEIIYSLLPQHNRAELQRAFAVMIPGPSDAMKMRLVFEQVVSLTFGAVADAYRRADGPLDHETRRST